MLPLEFGWRDLLFANWPVDAAVVAERVPDALDVQTFDGTAWCSVVPFVNVDLRPRPLPAWLGLDVPEVNLRTYVVHDGEPGVYFLSLDAESVAGVLGARPTHFLPYYYARIDVERDADGLRYDGRRRHPGARAARFSATVRPRGDAFRAEPDTLVHFLAERRRLYTEGLDGGIRYTDVRHAPYPLYEADVEVHENTLFEANRFPGPSESPLCLYSPGVDVTTTRSRRRT